MLFYCVRHGESVFNAEGRIQGQLDPPLSEFGRRQAQAVAEALGQLPIEAIYASPLRRALETATPLGAALGLPITTDDRLKEINAGIFQGLVWDEITARHPDEAALWRAGEPDWVVPEGESRRTLMERGSAAFAAIRESGRQRVIVVAHGGLLTATFKALLGVPAERNPFSLYNGSINLLAWDKALKLITLNQVEHLVRHDAHHGMAGDLY